MTDQWRFLLPILLVGVIGCGHSAEPGTAADSGSEPHVLVKVESARLGTLAEAVEGLGRCETLPDHLATLTPAVEGHVQALLVKQGDTVKKGQPIVELDQAVALADLTEKTATRDGLKASLTLLKSLPRPEEQKPMVLAIDQAKVAVERAQAIVEKLRPLQARNEVSPQVVFDAEKALTNARLMQESAEAQHHVHMIGPRPEAVAEAEARIKTADGLVAFSQAHLDFHTIRSPIDGVLDSLTCHPGQTISIGSPIGEVVDTRQVYASVWLSPRSALSVRAGQPARVRPADDHSPSASDSEKLGESLEGKVDFVGRVADPQTGNLPVRVMVENSAGRLALGQMLRVSITLEERRDVLQVPVAAVLDLGEGPVLEVVRDGKSAVLHPTLGKANGGWVAISGTDLKPGERVIIEGGYSLPEGTPVKVIEAKAVARAEVGR
jgi:RND family efflux transporter MFP subunit